ncbi:MAG TPA: transcriptional repressor [Acidimicrobiales bacterium]|nr:transcriptional repressor [Acidimicrobiales bacterium]
MNEVHELVGERLRQIDQRYTSGRRALVDLLLAATRPLTLPEIVAGGAVAQSSAYRNLAVLEQATAVHRIVAGPDEFARYELAEDLTRHHHHLVCTACGDVADYAMPAAVERAVARALERVAADTGFAPESHRLDLVGKCTRCA